MIRGRSRPAPTPVESGPGCGSGAAGMTRRLHWRRAMLTGRCHTGACEAVHEAPPRVNPRNLRLLLSLLAAALLAAAAGPAVAHAEATDTVEFSCTGVTYHYTGFPNAANNTITET